MSTNPRCKSIQQILGAPMTRLYARAGSEAQRAAPSFEEPTDSWFMLFKSTVFRSGVFCAVATSGLYRILPRQPTAIVPTFLSVLALSTPISAPSCLKASYYIAPSFHSFLILRQYNIHYQLTPLQYCNMRAVDHGVEDVVDLDNNASGYCVSKHRQSLNGNRCYGPWQKVWTTYVVKQ